MITLLIVTLSAIAFTLLGLLAGFILGFLRGLRVERAEVEQVEEGLRDFTAVAAKPKLQVSHSKRERDEMKLLDDTFPVPDIRKTLEERSRGRE